MTGKANIYFYNTLCSKKVYNVLFDTQNVKSSNAAQNFFRLIATGFSKHEGCRVFVTSLLPINSVEHKKLFWNFNSDTEDNIYYKYIPLINIRIFRNIWVVLYVFFTILFKKFETDCRNVIVVDYLRISLNISVIIAAKIRGVKILSIVTDLPGENVFRKNTFVQATSGIHQYFDFDYFISLTKELNSEVNKRSKPNIVIEGFADISFMDLKNLIADKFEKRVVIYGGGLYEEYGLKILLDGFHKLVDNDVELWLYGEGPYVQDIIRFSKLDSRIRYKGNVSNEDLLQQLIKATLLINPRPPIGRYTKYSFPSKNMEYMSTGTPLLTAKLPGIPLDHLPFVYLIGDSSSEGIYNSLKDVLSRDRLLLHEFGRIAKAYVLEKKNNVFQTGRILKLIFQN